jgi:hypothetical protein
LEVPANETVFLLSLDTAAVKGRKQLFSFLIENGWQRNSNLPLLVHTRLQPFAVFNKRFKKAKQVSLPMTSDPHWVAAKSLRAVSLDSE